MNLDTLGGSFVISFLLKSAYQAPRPGLGGQKEDNFEKRNKPNCCELAIWLILLVIRVGLEPTTPTLKVFVAPRHLKDSLTLAFQMLPAELLNLTVDDAVCFH